MKILIVEDNGYSMALFKELLRYHGYDTIEAKDGAEGVSRAKEQIPDLILLDIQMPVMDGLTALKMLKETDETKNIKVIALTSYAMKGDSEKLIAAGFDYCVTKPIDTRELPKIIQQILNDK